MMNETQDFPMPTLIAIGPEQMLERAKANGLLVLLCSAKTPPGHNVTMLRQRQDVPDGVLAEHNR